MRKIGIVPLYDTARSSLWMLPGYMDGISQAGGLPVMLPLTDAPAQLRALADDCDGFLFPGGQDVDPTLYGAAASPHCGETCPPRDAMETALLREILRRDKPLLGICRGIQLLNAALGGTLYQDLPTEHPSRTTHHMTPPYDRAVHTVTVTAGSPLAALLGDSGFGVNSYHHQAIRTLSPRLLPMAVSEDGLVEAVFAPAYRFVWAVQWHPELSFRVDARSRAIFGALVRACGGRANAII